MSEARKRADAERFLAHRTIRSNIVCGIYVDRVQLGLINELDNLNCPGALKLNLFQVLLLNSDVLALLILIAFGDLGPGQLAVFGTAAVQVDSAAALLVQLI